MEQGVHLSDLVETKVKKEDTESSRDKKFEQLQVIMMKHIDDVNTA